MEDVQALNDKLEALKQQCACDNSRTVQYSVSSTSRTDGKLIQENSTDAKPSMTRTLLLAFKQEKQENIKLRNALSKQSDEIADDIEQLKFDVTRNITEETYRLTETFRNAVQNITETEDKVRKSVSETELTLKQANADTLQNMTLFVNNTERNIRSELLNSMNTLREEVNQSMSSIYVVPYARRLLTVRQNTNCPRSDSDSGLYRLSDSSPTLDNSLAYCDTQTDGGGWLVFQRRQDGSVDFYRGWDEYKNGFGSPLSEFWWGLEKLHHATKDRPRELRVDLEDFSGNKAYVHYSSFRILSEKENYAISVRGYSGTAGDDLNYHNGRPFTTKDRDHDAASFNCAMEFTGAWWFNKCFAVHLNGKYQFPNGSFPDTVGPIWIDFNEKKALKFTEMKLR